ncbi:MAG TPA: FAD-dependent oxidoreductase [Solirubrobacteraceae bacterium]|nr:FAD-dependent oxidoreductase [Solirubrobacteraceae bacterium]
MPEPRTIVIAGAGMAGAKAAESLRAEGYDKRIVLIGEEPEAPYERPPLSKDYLRGESSGEQARVHDAGFYATHDVELICGTRVTSVEPSARAVVLEDGRRLDFDRLLLATGSIPRRPPIPGGDLGGIHVLRTLADADRLKSVLARRGRVVLVGAGWIGCEIAASARQLGVEVTLVDQTATPLERVLGAELGAYFTDLHRRHGVDLRLGAGVAGFDGDRDVERIALADGTTIETQAVVLGVGVAPATQLAAAAGLAIENGILADEWLRTSAAAIFAAGDVANAMHPRYARPVRVEHWAWAMDQGTAAGRLMLGAEQPYDALPYFFSDQYDTGLEYVGLHGPGDRVVVRGSLAESAFQAFWLDAEDRVTAGMHVNDWDAIEPIKRLIESGRPMRATALASRDVPVELEEVART